jgi:site-specific recombinase XerD
MLTRARVSVGGALEGDPDDDWSGLSEDLISRFLDVLAVKFRYSRVTRAAHRAELHTADRWIRQHTGRTLAAASKSDLQAYMMQRRSNGVSEVALSASLRHLRRFYAFLLESHARADDPLAGVTDISQDFQAPSYRRQCELTHRDLDDQGVVEALG